MNRSPARGILLALTLLAAIALPAGAQQTDAPQADRAALARQIRQTLRQLQQLREERRRLQQQHADRAASLDGRIAELEHQVSEIRNEVDRAQQRVNQLEQAIGKARQQRDRLEQSIETATEAVTAEAESVRQRIERGIPMDRADRAGEAASVAQRAAGEEVQEQTGAVEDYFSLMGQELRRAGSRNRWNEPVHLDGGQRREHAYQVRLGLMSQMFVSEDGSLIGLAANSSQRSWRTELDRSLERSIRAAVDMMRERQPPQLSPVPVPYRPATAEISGSESPSEGEPAPGGASE